MNYACDDAQLYEITHKRRPSAQARALRGMGIEHRVRPDGTVFVLLSHVEYLLNPGKRTTVGPREPNWDAMKKGNELRARRRARSL